MPASGTFEWSPGVSCPIAPSKLGAVVTKSVTLRPQAGNPPGRVAETPAGMLNAIGIPSPGLDVFIDDTLPACRQCGTALIVSVQAYSPAECTEMTARLEAEPGIHALELNLSCPNLGHALMTAQSAELSAEMVAAARVATGLPLLAKLSPNVTAIGEIARAVEAAGADALVVANTLKGLAIDVGTRRALLGNVSGGLSGPAVRPVALYMVWECYEATRIPIVGSGGISTAEDVLQFMLAGARAVQVGTATFRDPRIMPQIIAELEAYTREHDLPSLAGLVGWCHQEENKQED